MFLLTFIYSASSLRYVEIIWTVGQLWFGMLYVSKLQGRSLTCSTASHDPPQTKTLSNIGISRLYPRKACRKNERKQTHRNDKIGHRVRWVIKDQLRHGNYRDSSTSSKAITSRYECMTDEKRRMWAPGPKMRRIFPEQWRLTCAPIWKVDVKVWWS